MSLTPKDVENIAWLARLEFTAEQRSGLVDDLSAIMGFVDQLTQAPVTDIAPMAHPLRANQRFRDDRVTESDQREEFQANAPVTEAGLYLVPRVIE